MPGQKLITLGVSSLILLVFIACSTQKPKATDSHLSKKEIQEIGRRMPELIGSRRALQRTVEYPKSCQEASAEGTVIIGFIVTKEGETEDLKVLRGIGFGCAQAALRALDRAEFTPGIIDGKLVEIRMSFPIVFRLD